MIKIVNAETAYLDYVNNFLTVEKFAEHYGISEKEALNLIQGQRNMLQANLTRYRSILIKFKGPTNHKPSRAMIHDTWNDERKILSISQTPYSFEEAAYIYLTEERKIKIQARTYHAKDHHHVFLTEDFATRIK